MQPIAPPKLVIAVVGAAHELARHKRLPYYVAVADVMERLQIGEREKVEEAIQYAVDRDLLRAGGGWPPRSIVITAEGLEYIGQHR